MSDDFSPPAGGDSDFRADEVPSLLQIWFGVRYSVGRKVYAWSGLGLALFKYAAETAAIYDLAGHLLLPWEFLNPLLSSRQVILQGAPEWLGWALFAWNLPFVWIAFSMSVRRAADAGFSPWTGMLVLIPILNLFVMLGLAIVPSSYYVPIELNPRWMPRSRTAPAWKETRMHFRSALLAIGAGLLIGLAILGLSVYVLRVYSATLFFGTPLLMGACAGFIYNRPHPQSWGGTLGVSCLLMFVVAGALILFALEGLICVLMAAPLVLPLGLIGGAIGKAIAESTGTSLTQTFLVLLALPILLGAESLYRESPEYVVVSSVEIDAPPETVWRNVVQFPDLPEPEEWYFKMGVSCPMRARIEGEGVGAVRYCEFTTGAFVEPITVWDEPRHLAFDVTAQPEPMRELSPYRHVHPPHMEHQTLLSRRGEFRLIPLPDGRTRLEGRTWYTFEMFPQNYWTLWSDTTIHRIHERVLNHIKQLSEQPR